MPMRCERKVSTVSSGNQLPVSLKAFSPAKTSFHSMRLAVLLGRSIKHQPGRRPDVDASAITLDERDDWLVRDLKCAFGRLRD